VKEKRPHNKALQQMRQSRTNEPEYADAAVLNKTYLFGFLIFSVTVVFGCLLASPFFTNRPVIALLTLMPIRSPQEMDWTYRKYSTPVVQKKQRRA